MKRILKFGFLYFIVLSPVGVFAQNPQEAILDSLKKNLSTYNKTDTNKVRLIYRIASPYANINTDSAMAYARQGFAMAKKLKWAKGIGSFYLLYGTIYSNQSKYDKSLANALESYRVYQTVNYKKGMTSALNDIGATYHAQGDYTKSLEYNFKALKLAEDLKNEKLISLINSNIGNDFSAQNNYKEALNYSIKALKGYERINDADGIATACGKIGVIYYEQKNLKGSAAYYQKAINNYRLAGNKLGEATTLMQIAVLYSVDLDKKLDYLMQAKEIFNAAAPNHSNSISNLGNIGGTYADIFVNKRLKKGVVYRNIPQSYEAVAKKAEIYLTEAIEYSKKANDAANLSYFSDNLAQLQEKTGNYKMAFNNYKLSRSIDDSLYSQENKNKIASLQAQYNFRKKEESYRQQQQITRLEVKQIYLYAALCIFTVSAILVYLLNRSRIGRLKLKGELERKDAERQTGELIQRNKLLESELKVIRSQMNPHFIFNVLNSIESYILENDAKTASKLVQKFASLSRIILESSTQALVTADREWRALELYTDLEAIRFANQFNYSFRADPSIDLSMLMLPPMLVQPLIENAIHHGLRNSSEPNKMLTVTLDQTANSIYFTVTDNGIGINEAQKTATPSFIKSKSIGIAAIRERVEILNIVDKGVAASLHINQVEPAKGKGTIAVLTLNKIIRQHLEEW